MDSKQQQANAWLAVCRALDDVAPGWWMDFDKPAKESAVDAIKALAAKAAQAPAQKPAEPRPFDLEAAKRGEPIVTRDGRNVRFVAHDPLAEPGFRVLAVPDGWGEGLPAGYYENGAVWKNFEQSADLFMAPKPKRKAWMNAYYYDSKLSAEFANHKGRIKQELSVPVEIDA